MNDAILSNDSVSLTSAKKILKVSVTGWFVTALAGQWTFALYISVIYTLTALYGLDVTSFSPAPNLKQANGVFLLLFFAHVIPAIYLSLFGILQLAPKLRNKYRTFHRINGTIFLMLSLTGAITGLTLQWSKGWQTNTAASLGITLNGLLILVTVSLAWFYARTKQFNLHKRWAIHAFFLVNGVWTFRLYLMGWYLVNQGPNGNTANIDGPADIALSFACYLLPMLFAELYFWAEKQTSLYRILSSAFVMSIGVLITLIGVVAAGSMMWAPRVFSVLAAL